MLLRKSTALVSLVCLSLTAHAAEETVSLETITVSGTKEDKPLYQNTESVSILQAPELPATGRENDLQVINAVPNVQVNQSRGGESFSIRGINSTGVTGYQMDNLASILVDDVFQTDLATQAGSFSLWDVERVEILKGAQSTSQGVNSLAGNVLLDHNRPQFSTEGAAKVGLGNFWYRNLGVVSNNVLASDKLASRISYDKEQSNGYITNIKTGNENWGNWDRDRVRAALLYKLSSDSSLSFDGKFNQNRQGGTYVQSSDPFKHEVNEDVDFRSETKNYQFSVNSLTQINASLSNKAIFGFSKSSQGLNSDADGTPQNTAGTRFENHDDRYMSVENRLLYKNEKFNNLLGLHVHDFSLNDDYDFNLLYPLGANTSTPIAVTQDVDRSRKAYAIFDSATYSIDEHNSVIGGARVEYVDSKYSTNVTGRRLQNLGGANAAVDAYLAQVAGQYEGRKTDTVVLPKAGYAFTNGPHYAGLTYTRGYRTSGVSINRRRATAVEYDPEFTNNYEAAYKFKGQDFLLATNLFYIDWTAQQVQVQLSNDFYDTQVQNAAKSRVYGAEFEGHLNLRANDRLSLGVGYANTRFNEFTIQGKNYEGNQFPFASPWTSRISYEHNVNQQWKFLTVLRYLSGAYTNAENTRKSDAQFYTNLNTTYTLDAWVFEGYVNNVFNGEYLLFDGTPTSTTSPYQASYHQTSVPREFGARATYYW